MSKIHSFFKFLNHFKYFFVIIIGVVCVGFLGNSSFLNLAKMNNRKADLRAEISNEQAKDLAAKKEMQRLEQNPLYIEHVAREKYMMKHDDEDVYVMKSQLKKIHNETAK